MKSVNELLNSKVEVDYEELVDELMSNDAIKSLVMDNDLSARDIIRNANVLLDYEKDAYFDKDLKIADVEYILPLVSEGNKLNSSKLIKYGSVTAIAAIGLGYSLYLFHNKSNKETCVK